MPEDASIPPLPRRAPGDSGRSRAAPVAPAALPKSVVQRILATLDAEETRALLADQAITSEPPAPAHMAPTEPPATLPPRGPDVSTWSPPSAPVPPPGPSAEETGAKPDSAAPCPSATTPSAGRPSSALRPTPAGLAPDEPGHRDDGPAGPQQPASREEPPASPLEPPASREEPPAGREEPALPRARTRRRQIIAAGVILVVLLAAGLLAVVLARHASATAGERHRTGTGAEAAIRGRAVAWVADQVSRAVRVSCDRVMCESLVARGVPAASLLELRPGAADPLRSGVVVATAAVRGMLGNRLVTVYTPAAIASFGSGSARIDIRAVAPRGAAAFSAAFSADIAARKAYVAPLLHMRRIVISAAARRPLAAGQVDPRLLVDIAGLASQLPVSVVSFGDAAPGASPGTPLRSADLTGTGTAASRNRAQVRSMSFFLRGQRGSYLPARIQTVPLPGGRSALRVEFAAPSPIGLLRSLLP